MKKLILLLFIPLVFGCSTEPVNVFENEFSNFEGLWSGSIGDISNGTWTFSIDELGVVSGSITSFEHNEMYSINGSVNESGYVESNVTSIQSSRNSTVGSFDGNIDEDMFYGSFNNENDSISSNISGDISTDDESSIVNTWYFYSAEYPSGEIYFFDNQRYCSNLYMSFNDDGTFTDYFVADYSDDPNPSCNEEDAFFGTFSVQDGYYQFTYEEGGNQDLSGSDIYISYPDSETMVYEFDSVLWTYIIP